jgi:hypothetical protein
MDSVQCLNQRQCIGEIVSLRGQGHFTRVIRMATSREGLRKDFSLWESPFHMSVSVLHC